MYMPGRLRTASSPSRTVMEEAPYSGTEVPTAAWAAGSCLLVPFKGFPRHFLTRAPHAHKPVSGLQVADLARDFGSWPTLEKQPSEASGVCPRRPLRTVQNPAQIGEHGGVREEGAGELPPCSIGQAEHPARSPATHLLDGLDLRPEHPFRPAIECSRQLGAGEVHPHPEAFARPEPPGEPGKGAAQREAGDCTRRGGGTSAARAYQRGGTQ